MNKTLIALLISSVVLAGCGKSDAEIKAEQAQQAAVLEQIAQANAKQQQEAEDAELVGVLAELKKGDPLIKDAYYGYNEKGDRVLHVVRDNPPQQQQQQVQPQYAQGANGQPVIINNQPAPVQQASSGVSESVWPLLAGVGGGMLLAQAMNSGGGYQNYQQNHRPYSYNSYNDNDYRQERTKVVNNYHTTVVNKTREVVRKDPVYQQRAATVSRVQPAVKQNTAANFGQSRIQSTAQPSQFRQTQPAVKPASSGWGLGSSSSKPTSTTTVKSNSGGWGSSSSSSSFRPSSSSKSTFSSSSSSSRSSGFSSSRSSGRR